MSQYCNCKSPTCSKCSSYDGRGEIGDSLDMSPLSITDTGCGYGYCGVPTVDRDRGYGDCGGVARSYELSTPEILIFVVEWYDNGSDLIKKYILLYYTIDGTCEVKDIINHQRFLRRLKLDTVVLPQLYLGNVINIYGRQMTLVDYADSCTRQYLQVKTERAFLLIKPEAVQCLGRILQVLEQNDFRILRAKMAQFTSETGSVFLKQFKAQEYFSRLLGHMTSAPVVAFLIVGENALKRLQYLAGEEDPGVAKLKHPTSLRAMYGKDVIQNGIYISESPACISQDTSIFFTECRALLPTLAPGPASMSRCSTCCIVKPHALKERSAGAIIDYIMRGNYKITAFELFYLDRTHADEFYEIYKGVLEEYSAMTAELAIGPCYGMEISGCGENTANSFREFCGPMDPTLARKLRPESIRAKFGRTKVENAVHCTDLCEDAEMELDYLFRILQMV